MILKSGRGAAFAKTRRAIVRRGSKQGRSLRSGIGGGGTPVACELHARGTRRHRLGGRHAPEGRGRQWPASRAPEGRVVAGWAAAARRRRLGGHGPDGRDAS